MAFREGQAQQRKGSAGDEGDFPPLEQKLIELTLDDGTVKKLHALSKRYAPNFKYVRFFLPKLESLVEDPSLLEDWREHIEILREDLKWLLKLPHYKFWSVFIYSLELSDEVLPSFLLRAPKFFDFEFIGFQSHPVIGSLYNEIYHLVFRIYMRLATFKESKEDHISPHKWASIIYENYLFDIPKIMDLCSLYESKDNHLLPKMIDNVFKHEPRLIQGLDIVIPTMVKKSEEQCKSLSAKVSENTFTREWDLKEFQELIIFSIDGVVSLYKFIKVYPAAARVFHRFPQLEVHLAVTYEKNTKLWKQILEYLPSLETQVNVWRVYLIRLFRTVLCTPTILSIDSTSGSTHALIDEYFDVMTTCLDENLFIHDYESTYPFRFDMQTLLSRGLFVDETRIEYLANAIEACFEACGSKYSCEKTVTDPLYDPSFDRQLLGACSLDVVGVELDSLVTQVKDLLPDLPRAYVEVCLKHFGYNAETVINAMLEGNVPEHLEKYKDETFVAAQAQVQSSYLKEDPVRDELPVAVALPIVQNSWTVPEDVPGMSFNKGKRRLRDEATFFDEGKELKQRILDSITREDSKPNVRPKSSEEDSFNTYLDESLLPDFDEEIEYNDEYDDTYDEAGVGMTEPDAQVFKPLNLKRDELKNGNGDNEMEEPEPSSSAQNGRNFENFVEDPALVRARMERRREEKTQQRRGYQGQAGPPRDVVGKAKGQGQEKDVVLNRRHKDQTGAHNRRKRADFKRKEF